MAMNPCHCGYHGSRLKQCKCSPLQIESYVGKISGPLMDRIAIHVAVQPVDVEMWKSSAKGMNSATMRDMVTRARELQVKRYAHVDRVDCNARLPDGRFAEFCTMDPKADALFIQAQKSLQVSARSRGHIVRVARTIADLNGCDTIHERHIMEAVGYRESMTTKA
jgi:magnesium chelatase family protein